MKGGGKDSSQKHRSAEAPGIAFPVASILNRLLEAFQLRFGAKYGIRNQESAETNGGHLQAASPGKIPGPAGASRRIHFGG